MKLREMEVTKWGSPLSVPSAAIPKYCQIGQTEHPKTFQCAAISWRVRRYGTSTNHEKLSVGQPTMNSDHLKRSFRQDQHLART
jgi:hypothetical protein